MQRRLPVALIISALAVPFLGAGTVTAQEDPPGVGVPITITDPDGIIRGSVTIREVADPFTGHDPSATPPDGMRYVALTVTFEAAPDQSLDAQPYHVALMDADGVLYTTQYVPRPADAQISDLQSQLMAPDDRVSGIVSFVMPAEATLDRIVYQPAYDRLVELVDLLPGAGPGLGDAVAYTDPTGATVTMSAQLQDPFTEFEPAYPPGEGTRFVMLQPVFENSGTLPYWAEPYDLYLRDGMGRLFTTTTINRPAGFSVPLLESQTLSPGDRISGYVGYVVPADAQLADVLYIPESSRVISLADLGGGGSGSAAPTPSTEASPPPAPGSPTPDPSAGTDR